MTEGIAARVLPHSLEAERAILGAVLLHADAWHEASEFVRPGDFFRDGHRRIWSAMLRLSALGTAIDYVTIKDALGRSGDLEESGGPAYLAALTDGMPRRANVEHYARIVREKADLRALIFAGQKMIGAAYEAGEDARDVLESAEQTIFQITSGNGPGSGFVGVGAVMGEVLERLEASQGARRGQLAGLPTGFDDLDNMTRGLQPGQIVLVAARPSMGKSAFAVNIAEHVATVAGRTVGVFSLEMSREELAIRSVTSIARVDSHRLQGGYLGAGEWARVSEAIATLSGANLHIDETGAIGVWEMRSRARRLQAEHGLDLLIVDYVQLMAGTSKRAENRTIELGEISRGLKQLAKELRIPIVVLSQLSRAPELRTDHRPMLSDLRESGALEQDADLVLFLYRDEYYNPGGTLRDGTPNAGIADVIVAKHRNGPIGAVSLRFNKQYTRFDNLDTAPGASTPALPYQTAERI